MNETFRLGRIAGIPIGLNWTWLLVFVLFVWSLESAVFPATNPGLSTATYLGMSVAAVLLFFGSLLLHELGHAVVARREGMTIDGITLWLFGGVSRFGGMFPSAGAEFRVAIAGPLVSAFLGAIFVALALLTQFATAVDGVAAWLGYINFLLLGFNLVPALPLDGGRVLHAILWRARGDFGWATQIAAGIGRVFGLGMIGLGVVLFFAQGAFDGLWLALIGWFLFGAAKAEAGLGATHDALEGLLVGDLIKRHPSTARAEQTLQEFMDEVADKDVQLAYPVLQGEQPVGLILLRRVTATPKPAWESLHVRDRMLGLDEVPVLRESDGALEALLALGPARVDRALVVDGKRLVGVLSAGDVEQALKVRPGALRRAA